VSGPRHGVPPSANRFGGALAALGEKAVLVATNGKWGPSRNVGLSPHKCRGRRTPLVRNAQSRRDAGSPLASHVNLSRRALHGLALPLKKPSISYVNSTLPAAGRHCKAGGAAPP
jgi:hypothetical protein